ncbi:hypothetical protein SALINJAH_13 [Bacillus phage SalinJah]|uniref:Uncharacterized protein n=1 Tax=Bacillus phage SalinJah TaxID=1837830 RepID=A0A173GBA7_9CAUD|nr:hypothetical protein SALINJAH_13 [Bacillus phage SalinJah]ANH50661.1 hypothetical protein SALINJAH_13 [Bacillus phage SalinJah]
MAAHIMNLYLTIMILAFGGYIVFNAIAYLVCSYMERKVNR